jgi:hypothetical protein
MCMFQKHVSSYYIELLHQGHPLTSTNGLKAPESAGPIASHTHPQGPLRSRGRPPVNSWKSPSRHWMHIPMVSSIVASASPLWCTPTPCKGCHHILCPEESCYTGVLDSCTASWPQKCFLGHVCVSRDQER